MKKWVIALVFGVMLVSFGAGGGRNDSNLIYCGSEIMSPGDVCEETSRGSTTTKTYAEMKASDEAGKRIFNSWGRWALLGGGVVLMGAGIAGIVATRRRRRNAGPTTADLHLAQARQQQQGQAYAPGPYQPGPPPSHAQQWGQPQQAPYPPQPQPQYQQPPQGQYPPQNFGPAGSQN
jgi:hypothetical protein